MAGHYKTTRSCVKDTAPHLRLLSNPFNMPAWTTQASVSATGELTFSLASNVWEEGHWRFPCLHKHFGRSVPGVFVSYLQMALPHTEHRCCTQSKRNCFQIASQIRTSMLSGRPLHRLECWLQQDLSSKTSLPARSLLLQPLLYPPRMSNLYLLSRTYTRHAPGSSMAGHYKTTRSCVKDTAPHLRLLSNPFNMPAWTTQASVSATGELTFSLASNVWEEGHWRFPCLHKHFGRSVPGVFVSYLQMALPHTEHRCCTQPKRNCFHIASQILTSMLSGRPLHRLECWLQQDLSSKTSLPARSLLLQPLLYPPRMSNL